MAKLIYSMITSVDGYVSDSDGNFNWGTPDQESHDFINGLMGSVGTYLYGRSMYQTMVFWETAHQMPDAPQFVVDYARTWQAADKVVFSRTLEEVSSERTHLVREFDPAAVKALKDSREKDLTVDGPGLAESALRAGLVDEVQLFVAPVAVGGGKRFLPDGLTLNLGLLEERRFDSGLMYLRYAVR
ncbi:MULTISPECIES: dihydrofolate reductase family protein [Arthrobacter]|uniref:Dihydrofolate reductase family protein n=2 Tax=Arthrobacter TaxID=1663 RepID=A0ABU9KL16_9MICC|nr:dihydrofolate reductase family protein [Arthrobacter sp. YJM1]MDP5227587.1 dihydrofolate reductase family protein [Arthrobacter sp. YJM1]